MKTAVVVLAWAAGSLACGGAGLGVERYPHPPQAPAEPVGFPPPPARVEHVAGSPPGRGCRWVDGQWLWLRQRWQWQAGRWVLPPTACRYSAPALHWTVGGEAGAGGDVLYYRPGRWYSEAEARICPDAPTCPGTEALDPTASPFPGP